MTNKNLVDLSFPKKKEREREITKILHEILPPSDLVLFHTDERSSVLNHVFPRRKTSDRDAKGHRRSRRRRRLGFLLFRSESIHVPASTIHIRRKRERKKKKRKRGRKISVAAASVSKQGRRIPTWKKVLRNVGFVSHLASVRRAFRNAFLLTRT